MKGLPRSRLPGFPLALGYTLLYLSLIVLIPLSAVFARSFSGGWEGFRAAAFHPRALASYRLTILTALAGASVNAVFGFLAAWVLVRYRFFGRKVLDACVDLPFALPTAVSGIALAWVYSPQGWIGRFLDHAGLPVAFTPLGIAVALTFVGLPFVIRTLQPALLDLDSEMEEAAANLGASRRQVFGRLLLPALLPSLLTGFALAFARALGEYGSVIFIAGNMPMRTEIAPLLVVIKLEEFDTAGAAAVAAILMVMAFAMLLFINLAQWRAGRRHLRGA